MTHSEDPPRLRDDAALRGLIDSAALDDDPEMVKRVGARLGFALAPSSSSPSTVAPGAALPAGAGPPVSGGVIGAVAAISVLVGLVVAALLPWSSWVNTPTRSRPDETHRSNTAARVRASNTAARVRAAETTAESPAPPQIPAQTLASTPNPRSARSRAVPQEAEASATAVARVNGVAAEIRLVESIRTAADPTRALELVRRYRVEYPNGTFRTECDRLERRALATSVE